MSHLLFFFLSLQWLKAISHAFFTTLSTLVSYAIGLNWFVGDVSADAMFDNGNPMETCSVRQEDGSTRTVEGEDCVSDGVGLARTMAFITIVYSEVLRGLTVRSTDGIWHQLFKNKHLLGAIVFSGGFATMVLFIPGFLRGTALEWWAWLLALTFSLLTVVCDEMLKLFLRVRNKNQPASERLSDDDESN